MIERFLITIIFIALIDKFNIVNIWINKNVSLLKKKLFVLQGKTTETLLFDIQGDNLNTQVWYRKKDMVIVKQVLNRQGVWRYEIRELN